MFCGGCKGACKAEAEIDPNAFIIVTSTDEVFGEGFLCAHDEK